MIASIPGFDEPVNAITHLGAAIVFALLGARLLWRHRTSPLRLAMLGVFVFAAVFTLSMSGVLHSLPDENIASPVFNRLDRAGIFVLIAGTFTAVFGVYFRGPFRWIGLALMWTLAWTGVTLGTINYNHLPIPIAIGLYLSLGWLAGLAGIALWYLRGFRYVRLVLYGGIAYSAGAVLLALDWPTIVPGVIGPHEVWHVAVIIGLALQWRFVERVAQEQALVPASEASDAKSPAAPLHTPPSDHPSESGPFSPEVVALVRTSRMRPRQSA